MSFDLRKYINVASDLFYDGVEHFEFAMDRAAQRTWPYVSERNQGMQRLFDAVREYSQGLGGSGDDGKWDGIIAAVCPNYARDFFYHHENKEGMNPRDVRRTEGRERREMRKLDGKYFSKMDGEGFRKYQDIERILGKPILYCGSHTGDLLDDVTRSGESHVDCAVLFGPRGELLGAEMLIEGFKESRIPYPTAKKLRIIRRGDPEMLRYMEEHGWDVRSAIRGDSETARRVDAFEGDLGSKQVAFAWLPLFTVTGSETRKTVVGSNGRYVINDLVYVPESLKSRQ